MGPPPPPPWGAEERFCGIGSLAKIWAEKFRDSGRSAPPCSPHAARLVQLLTSRIVTQEKTVPVPWGKRGSRHHSLCTTARRGCPTSTHTQYCEQKHGTAGRRGSLRPARSLKHSAAPEKPNKKIHLKLQKRVHPWGSGEGGRGGGGPLFPFCLQVSGALGAAPAGQDRVPRPPVSLKARPVCGCWVLVSVTAPCQPVRPWLQ